MASSRNDAIHLKERRERHEQKTYAPFTPGQPFTLLQAGIVNVTTDADWRKWNDGQNPFLSAG
jgi:hypothetical protein